jgi:hypothetical protein
MNRISDALELLTAQHDELDVLVCDLETLPAEHRAIALGELADKVTTHLAAEQELFYPSIVASVASSDEAMAQPIEQMISEHEQITLAVLALLQPEVNPDVTKARIATLAALLDHHRTSQDDGLFVAIAERLSNDALEGLGLQLRAWSESSLCIAA